MLVASGAAVVRIVGRTSDRALEAAIHQGPPAARIRHDLKIRPSLFRRQRQSAGLDPDGVDPQPVRPGFQRLDPQDRGGGRRDELESIATQVFRRLAVVNLADGHAVDFHPRMAEQIVRPRPNVGEPDLVALPGHQPADSLRDKSVFQIQTLGALESTSGFHRDIGIRPAREAALKAGIRSDRSR